MIINVENILSNIVLKCISVYLMKLFFGFFMIVIIVISVSLIVLLICNFKLIVMIIIVVKLIMMGWVLKISLK